MKFFRKYPGLICWSLAGLFLAALLVSWKCGHHPWNESIRSRASLADYKHDDFLNRYLWWAGVLSAVVWGFLGSTTRLWYASNGDHAAEEPVPRPKYWRLSVLAAMGIAGYIAAPRLMHSLWEDEQHSAQDYVHGRWIRELDEQGEVRQFFGRQSWWQTTTAYQDTNNHPLFSISSRLSLNFWRWLNDRDDEEFHEVAFRFPAFLLGLLALPAWGWLARVMGMQRGAVVFMVLLAVHPWFVRYMSEGRGYAFMLFGLPYCLGCACLALRTGRTRWWLRFSLWQIFLLLSWPGMGLLLLALNLACVTILLKPSAATQRNQFFAWGAANLISISVFLQWFLPGIMQGLASDIPFPTGDMDYRYPLNFLSHLAFGTVWSAHPQDAPELARFLPVGAQESLQVILSLLMAAGLLVFLFIGWRALRQQTFLRAALVAAVLLVVTVMGIGIFGASRPNFPFIFDWYFLWLMPLLFLLIAKGLETPGLNGWLVLTFCLLCARHASPFLQRLRVYPVEPLRESVMAMRTNRQQGERDSESLLTAHINQMATLYDRYAYEVTDVQTSDPTDTGLADLMQRAITERKPLLVNVGYPRAARINFPEIMKVIDASGNFQSVTVLPGQELGLSHEIFRFNPPATH